MNLNHDTDLGERALHGFGIDITTHVFERNASNNQAPLPVFCMSFGGFQALGPIQKDSACDNLPYN